MTLSGANRLTAAATGLRVEVATATALTMLAISSAIVAIFTVSQFSQAKADMFAGLDIDCIASVLVGGVALRGGKARRSRPPSERRLSLFCRTSSC